MEKRQRGLIDYADMIARTEEILRETPDTLQAVLGEIDCVVIDEFQDTNPVQFALLWRLAQHAPKALIVGDRKQAIMGFQGADPRLSQALDERFPDALDPLRCNWRSVPEVMEFVNSVGAGLFGSDYETLTPQADPGCSPALTVLNLEGKLDHRFSSIADYIQDVLESDREIRDPATGKLRSVINSDIAVLCYTKGHSQKMADALRALHLPVRMPENGWYDSLAVDMARAALSLAANPNDKFSALNISTRGPDRLDLALAFHGVNEGTLDAAETIRRLYDLAPGMQNLTVSEALQQVLTSIGLWDWAQRLPNADQAMADLKRFTHEAQSFDETPAALRAAAGFHGASIEVFLGWLSDLSVRGDDGHPDPTGWSAPGIEVSTWHSSKGREWPITIVAGWDKDIKDKPHSIRSEFHSFKNLDNVLQQANLNWHVPYDAKDKKDTQALKRQEADEAAAARAIYVALTRARDSLVLALPPVPKTAKDRPCTMFDLLRERTNFEQATGVIKLGLKSFPTHIKSYPKDLEFESKTAFSSEDTLSYGIPTSATEIETTLWRSSPSTLKKSKTTAPVAEHSPFADALPERADTLNSADRGTACHVAFRVMFDHPEAKDRLLNSTPLHEAEVNAIAAQAKALRNQLTKQGYTKFHLELPFQHEEDNGAQMNAIVDLLAESETGFAIVDHKTGKCTDLQTGLQNYWTQLEAYQKLVSTRWPDKPVQQIAINWMDEGHLSIITMPKLEKVKTTKTTA